MLYEIDYLYKKNIFPATKPRFSIIIPAFNEESRIVNTLLEWLDFLNDYCDNDFEILIMIDGCTDKTFELVSEISSKTKLIVPIYSEKKLGKGGAILQAFKMCNGDCVFYTDADGSLSASEFPKFVNALGNNDFVIGTRYYTGSIFLANLCFSRFFASRTFNVFFKLLFPKLRNIHDTQCAAKILRKRVIDGINGDLLITDFVFDVNLIFSAITRGFKGTEVKVQFNHVQNGSKVSDELLATGIKMFFSLIRLRLYHSRFKQIIFNPFFKFTAKFLMNAFK